MPGNRLPLFFSQEKELVELPKEIEERKKQYIEDLKNLKSSAFYEKFKDALRKIETGEL